MKKIIIILTALVVSFNLVSCGVNEHVNVVVQGSNDENLIKVKEIKNQKVTLEKYIKDRELVDIANNNHEIQQRLLAAIRSGDEAKIKKEMDILKIYQQNTVVKPELTIAVINETKRDCFYINPDTKKEIRIGSRSLKIVDVKDIPGCIRFYNSSKTSSGDICRERPREYCGKLKTELKEELNGKSLDAWYALERQ